MKNKVIISAKYYNYLLKQIEEINRIRSEEYCKYQELKGKYNKLLEILANWGTKDETKA